MKQIYVIGGIIFIAVVILLIVTKPQQYFYQPNNNQALDTLEFNETVPVSEDDMSDINQAESESVPIVRMPVSVIGTTAAGRDIRAYTYGTGSNEILLIAGVHGGYSWNTALLSYELSEYVKNIERELGDVRVTIIPTLNPDGLAKVVSSDGIFTASQVSSDTALLTESRFNARGVDLNRNFDCQWQATGQWQNRDVSGGSAPFSELEAQVLRDHVATHRPTAVIAYYSAAGGVYASECNAGVLSDTHALLNAYGAAAAYTQHAEFDYYEITGDMVNWFAKERIPAISVLLTNRTGTDRTKNIAGLQAVIDYYNAVN